MIITQTTFHCDTEGCAAKFEAPANVGLMASWNAAHDAGWASIENAQAGPRHPATGLRAGPLHHYACPAHKPLAPA